MRKHPLIAGLALWLLGAAAVVSAQEAAPETAPQAGQDKGSADKVAGKAADSVSDRAADRASDRASDRATTGRAGQKKPAPGTPAAVAPAGEGPPRLPEADSAIVERPAPPPPPVAPPPPPPPVRPARLDLFNKRNFNGTAMRLTMASSNISFSPRAARVEGGAWLVCARPFFGGRCDTLVGSYPQLNLHRSFSGMVRSARPVDSPPEK